MNTLQMKNIIDILKFVKYNTNSAFLYTPNIYENAKSYFLRTPETVLQADSNNIDQILAEMDKVASDNSLFGLAIIPYEIGYVLMPGSDTHINRNVLHTKAKLLVYSKNNVEAVNSKELDFTGVEHCFTKKRIIAEGTLNISKDEYCKNVAEIKRHISEGDVYQIDYTIKENFWLKKMI